jgi:hypothetical protein
MARWRMLEAPALLTLGRLPGWTGRGVKRRSRRRRVSTCTQALARWNARGVGDTGARA